jgi:hypothetical protein
MDPRTAPTTSFEETPAGLSTSNNPSGVVVIRGDCSIAHLIQERIDTRGALHALVDPELELGRDPQPKRAPDATAEVSGERGQPL